MSKMLLEHGVELICKDKIYGSPLSIAISKKNKKLIDLLIQYGAKSKKEIPQNFDENTLDKRWSEFLMDCNEEEFSKKLGSFVADEAGKKKFNTDKNKRK